MSNFKILIIEDDDDMAKSLSIRLRHAGYSVVMAPDAVLGTLMAQREKPDLVLLDLGLPGGDGLDVMDRIAQLDGPIPIVILTAKDPEGYLDKALERGVESFFTKPVDSPRLLDAIQEILTA